MIERGMGFAANILAARLGGASTFGAYSLAISTANQISTYAAGGIGATAVRFSGKYPQGSAHYSSLARALTIVSVASAVLAAAALLGGAGPIAHLLGKPSLTGLLRWSALSAVGMIVLECARGFFVGQRKLVALVLLSVVVGLGMLVLLPVAAARKAPQHMIVVQGAVTLGAVCLCLALAKPLGLRGGVANGSGQSRSLRTMLREVSSFGAVQLVGLLGANAAGWWLTTLVARADTTLVQMGFFAIASQLRNLAGIVPGLLTEGSYAVMADPEGEAERTPQRVMAICSFASLLVSLGLASLGMALAPWVLRLLYGAQYQAAELTVATALAIAVVHMGNAPAAARLTIVSIRSSGVINTLWAVFVAVAAASFLVFRGDAARAMLIYFLAHVLSSVLVLITLARRDGLPSGMATLYAGGTLASGVLVALAFVRAAHSAETAGLSGAMLLVAALAMVCMMLLGKKHGWLPTASMVRARLLRREAHV